MLVKNKIIYIRLPLNIKITIEDINYSAFKKIYFKGPLGNIFQYFIKTYNFSITQQKKEQKNLQIMYKWTTNLNIKNILKMYIGLIKNIFKGLLCGFIYFFRLKGLSYRIWYNKNKGILLFRLGFCHYLKFKNLKNIFLKKFNRRKFALYSIDYQLLNQTLLRITNYRFPDSYKGQGILYKYQKLHMKPGKKSYKNKFF